MKPLVGITTHRRDSDEGQCRGTQVMNVALGGTLYGDIASQAPRPLKHDYFPGYPRNHVAHPVAVSEETKLARILGMPIAEVNSLHHQAIKDAAAGVEVAARAPDGIVEAITRPIGIFDSGLGGLSVLREVRRQLPHEHVLYFADQGRLPYGPRPIEEVRQFAGQITRFLLERDAEVIVVACNTASAAALADLRKTFPHAPFVGMEPAVKPAAEQTQSRIVGVIATEATCQSEVFASVVERFANGVTVLTRACPGLVAQVEAGDFSTPATRRLLHEYLDPMLAAGIDSLVLGCTHFPFLTPAITEIVGPNVRVVDPAPAVTRQVGRVINQRRPMASAFTTGPGSLTAFTTGNPPAPSELASQMIGEPIRFRTLHVSILARPTRS